MYQNQGDRVGWRPYNRKRLTDARNSAGALGGYAFSRLDLLSAAVRGRMPN